MGDTAGVPSDGSRRDYLSRAYRTFVAVCVVLAGALFLTAMALGPARLETAPPAWLSVPALIVVSTLVTGWLVNGGYDRLGADPTAVGRFVEFGFLFLPLALLPTTVALDAAGIGFTSRYAIVLSVTVVVAGWLAFYDGLDRLGVGPGHVAHAAGVAIAFCVVGYGIEGHLVSDQFRTPVGVAIAALAAQVGALWLGFGGYVDRRLA